MSIIESLYDSSKRADLVHLIDLQTWETYVGARGNLAELLKEEEVRYIDNILFVRGKGYILRNDTETIGFQEWKKLADLDFGDGNVNGVSFENHNFSSPTDEFGALSDLAFHKVLDDVSKTIRGKSTQEVTETLEKVESSTSDGFSNLNTIDVKRPRTFKEVKESKHLSLFLSLNHLWNYFWFAVFMSYPFFSDEVHGVPSWHVTLALVLSIVLYLVVMSVSFGMSSMRNVLVRKSLMVAESYYASARRGKPYALWVFLVGVCGIGFAWFVSAFFGGLPHWYFVTGILLASGILMVLAGNSFDRLLSPFSVHANGGADRWLYTQYLADTLKNSGDGYLDLPVSVTRLADVVDLNFIYLGEDDKTGFFEYSMFDDKNLVYFYDMFRTKGIDFLLYRSDGKCYLRLFLDGHD